MLTRFRVVRGYLRASLRCLYNALRVLLRGTPKPSPELQSEVEAYLEALPPHPSTLCTCSCGKEGALKDHDAACKWLAAMCRACEGRGWCKVCMGDGTRAEGDGNDLLCTIPAVVVAVETRTDELPRARVVWDGWEGDRFEVDLPLGPDDDVKPQDRLTLWVTRGGSPKLAKSAPEVAAVLEAVTFVTPPDDAAVVEVLFSARTHLSMSDATDRDFVSVLRNPQRRVLLVTVHPRE